MTYDRSNGGLAALEWAETKVGWEYQWGGTGNPSYDCSGLVQAAYLHVGVSLPRTTEEQYQLYQIADHQPYEPGDCLYYVGSPMEAPPGHVGIYVGVGSISADQHTFIPNPRGMVVIFNAPYTNDPHGIRYDISDTLGAPLYSTRPALALPVPSPPPIPAPEDEMEAIAISSGGVKGDWYVKGTKRVNVSPGQLAALLALKVQRVTITDAELEAFDVVLWGSF